MGHVFISYARSDRVLVDRIRKELAKARKKDWLDVDGIAAGGDWRLAIDEALKKAGAVVLILSPESSRSQYVTYEWSFALGAGIPVIPVMQFRSFAMDAKGFSGEMRVVRQGPASRQKRQK